MGNLDRRTVLGQAREGEDHLLVGLRAENLVEVVECVVRIGDQALGQLLGLSLLAQIEFHARFQGRHGGGRHVVETVGAQPVQEARSRVEILLDQLPGHRGRVARNLGLGVLPQDGHVAEAGHQTEVNIRPEIAALAQHPVPRGAVGQPLGDRHDVVHLQKRLVVAVPLAADKRMQRIGKRVDQVDRAARAGHQLTAEEVERDVGVVGRSLLNLIVHSDAQRLDVVGADHRRGDRRMRLDVEHAAASTHQGQQGKQDDFMQRFHDCRI